MVDSPYKDREWLSNKYYEEDVSVPEIADECDVKSQTIYYWMDKFGLERDATKWGHKSRVERATLYLTRDGHERWTSKHRENGERVTKTVLVHQLLAIAEGESPFKIFSERVNVHHENEIPWDNRPENISVLGVWEHMKTHRGIEEDD